MRSQLNVWEMRHCWHLNLYDFDWVLEEKTSTRELISIILEFEGEGGPEIKAIRMTTFPQNFSVPEQKEIITSEWTGKGGFQFHSISVFIQKKSSWFKSSRISWTF